MAHGFKVLECCSVNLLQLHTPTPPPPVHVPTDNDTSLTWHTTYTQTGATEATPSPPQFQVGRPTMYVSLHTVLAPYNSCWRRAHLAVKGAQGLCTSSKETTQVKHTRPPAGCLCPVPDQHHSITTLPQHSFTTNRQPRLLNAGVTRAQAVQLTFKLSDGSS
jgi:hypothetical protein